MTILRWIRTYWYIPVIVVVSVLGWIIFRRRPPTETIQTELDVIHAGVEAQKTQAEVGAEMAVKMTREKYAAKMEVLDAEERAQAYNLESDPVALARFLERITR